MHRRLMVVASKKYQTVGWKGFRACRSLLVGLALRDIIRPSFGLMKVKSYRDFCGKPGTLLCVSRVIDGRVSDMGHVDVTHPQIDIPIESVSHNTIPSTVKRLMH